LTLLGARGPAELKTLAKGIPFPRRSVLTKALELRRAGLVQTDENGLWSLTPQRTAATAGKKGTVSSQAGGAEKSGQSARHWWVNAPDEDLTPQFRFARELARLDVAPGIANLLAETLFTQDPYDLKWLYEVLTEMGEGFVSESPCRLIMRWWAGHCGLPYNRSDFFK
jgi:hypothetical protein